MDTDVHPESGLRKATLRNEDLVGTRWDLCRIHALAATDEWLPEGLTVEERQEMSDLDPSAPSALKLQFDLDYIVSRFDPGPMRDVRYWVAPATLIFSCVQGIVGSLRSLYMPLEMTDLRQEPAQGPGLDPTVPYWHLEGRDMDLRFQAYYYTLYVRRPPTYGPRVLRLANRGGISFDPHPYA